jgi:hypothetical protein
MVTWSAPDWYLKDCAKIGNLARRVGGYEELIRLDRQYRDLKTQFGNKCEIQIVKDLEGKFQCIIK